MRIWPFAFVGSVAAADVDVGVGVGMLLMEADFVKSAFLLKGVFLLKVAVVVVAVEVEFVEAEFAVALTKAASIGVEVAQKKGSKRMTDGVSSVIGH